MSKLIALRSGFSDSFSDVWKSDFSSQLKQQALLFDQIGIFHLRQAHKIMKAFNSVSERKSGHVLSSINLELEWLEENSVIFELTVPEEITKQAAEYVFKPNSSQKEQEASDLFLKLVQMEQINIADYDDMTKKVDLIKERDAIFLRLISLVMETTKGVTAVTTLPYIEYARELPNSDKSNVAQIVISKLPLPNNETPWEQIIDYRNDEDNQRNLLNLRRWIRKISTENLSSVEIEEELEWLLNEFQNHMKLHKLKANTETLEVMVKVLPETIENLIKLKFSKLPEPFFALKKRQINLMEAELNAPGREMSYIIKTQETFQPHE